MSESVEIYFVIVHSHRSVLYEYISVQDEPLPNENYEVSLVMEMDEQEQWGSCTYWFTILNHFCTIFIQPRCCLSRHRYRTYSCWFWNTVDEWWRFFFIVRDYKKIMVTIFLLFSMLIGGGFSDHRDSNQLLRNFQLKYWNER